MKQQLAMLTDLQAQMTGLKSSLQFANKRIDDLYNTSLPTLAADVERVSTALAVQSLDIDVHHRKWALSLLGLKHKSPTLGNVPHKQGEVTVNLW